MEPWNRSRASARLYARVREWFRWFHGSTIAKMLFIKKNLPVKWNHIGQINSVPLGSTNMKGLRRWTIMQ